MMDFRRLSTFAGMARRLKTPVALSLFLFAALVLSRPAAAQNIYAAVHGTVTDTSGAAIPGAAVAMVNTSTGITTKAITDSHGYYSFPQLQIGGPYTTTITSNGFETFSSTGLTLNVNDNRDVSAKLEIGSSVETVEVKAAAVQVETSDTQLKQVFTAQQLEEAPLLGRDVTGLQKLAPGNMESSDRFGNFSSNGSQTQSNAYLVNGADITDSSLQSEGLSVNPDALAEQNIVTSTLNRSLPATAAPSSTRCLSQEATPSMEADSNFIVTLS